MSLCRFLGWPLDAGSRTCVHKRSQEGDQGGPLTPLEGAKWQQKVHKWILEGAKIKYFGRLNTSLEGAELFGPPKIRAQLRLLDYGLG